jgi:hypothetical protein
MTSRLVEGELRIPRRLESSRRRAGTRTPPADYRARNDTTFRFRASTTLFERSLGQMPPKPLKHRRMEQHAKSAYIQMQRDRPG